MERETYLTFVLGSNLFAVNVVNVLEVLEQQQITRVPRAPADILGIINFRGEILPVVNTRKRFNLPETDSLLKNYVIVFEIGREEHLQTIAASADGVKDVIEIVRDEIKPVPEMGMSFDSRYVSGVLHRNTDFILLIDIEKIFTFSDVELSNQLEAANQ